MSNFLHPRFLEGRHMPNVHPESQDAIDWWNEQIRRCYEGFEYRGTRVTGDFYWFVNFFPIIRLLVPGNAAAGTTFDLPWPSQDDEYLCKQFEEAEQEGRFVMFFTARGYGKTYLVISVGAKDYMLKPLSHSIFAASSENHIKETFNGKLLPCIDEMNKRYSGYISKNTAKRDESDLISGVKSVNEKGEDTIVGFQSRCERIIYGTKEGATKGRRPSFQLFEEVGDWAGAAKLKECNAASRGSFMRGSLKTARVFYIGTGGQMASGGSRHAKDMFHNPDAFNIYKVQDWKKTGTGIFIPSQYKREGFWEQTGVSDTEGAMKNLMAMREAAKSDTLTYYRLLQEFPLTPDELFLVSGTNIFPQVIIAEQLAALDEEGQHPVVETGFLDWVYASATSSTIAGVKWRPDPRGPIRILEHPVVDAQGNAFPDLYIAGYDGIDIGGGDSESGNGSGGAISVKKRFLNSTMTSNLYVCQYCERPDDVHDNYENVMKISYYYGAQINIEFSRVRIIGYFRERGQAWRFMKRPSISSGDIEFGSEKVKETNLVGTIMNERIKDYGQQAVALTLRQFGRQFWFREALEQLRDYTPEEQTHFDLVVSMMLTEIADDELLQVPAQEAVAHQRQKVVGYYTDARGIKRYGVLPGQQDRTERLFRPVGEAQSYAPYFETANMSGGHSPLPAPLADYLAAAT